MSQRSLAQRRSVAVFGSLALLYGSTIHARPDGQGAVSASTLSIEDAINAAKRCLRERNVSFAGKFIESATFQRNQRDNRGPYWTVTWASSREAAASQPMIVGGEVIVAVFQTRRCEVRYGE